MHRVVMPVTTKAPSASRLQVGIHLQAEIVATEAARRRANAYLLEHVGNLLRAETTKLILGERLIWQSEVVLTNPTVGVVGPVSRIDLDAATARC